MHAVEFFVVKNPGYSQQRRHPRVPVDFRVWLKTGGFRVSDRARDLSECGVGLQSSQPLAPMSLVEARLEVPNEKPFDVLCRVMWATKEGMGLRFEQLDPRLSDSVTRLREGFARI
jgi:hypothetical protein